MVKDQFKKITISVDHNIYYYEINYKKNIN